MPALDPVHVVGKVDGVDVEQALAHVPQPTLKYPLTDAWIKFCTGEGTLMPRVDGLISLGGKLVLENGTLRKGKSGDGKSDT